MEPAMESNYILAIDIGGTKTAAAVVDTEGTILARKQEPTCQSGPQNGIAQITRMLNTLIEKSQISSDAWQSIGVGIPAVLEPQTDFVIWGPNLQGWRKVDLSGELQRNFGLPVAIEYDGHAAALGEWWVGAGRDYHSFVNVIIGTGIGGGMILNGKLFRGANRLAGAVGWFVLSNDLEPDFMASAQSHLGYWETKAAGPGIAAHARSLVDQFPHSSLTKNHASNDLKAKSIFAAYAEEDPFAVKVLHDLAIVLGRGIANIISLVNPDAIVLGGGVGAHCDVLIPRIKEEIARWAQPISSESVDLVVSTLGSEAGLLGAAFGAILRTNHSHRKESA